MGLASGAKLERTPILTSMVPREPMADLVTSRTKDETASEGDQDPRGLESLATEKVTLVRATPVRAITLAW